MNCSQASLIILIVLVALGFSVSTTLVHLLTEAWWFDAVGFTQVFWTRLTWQILIWVVTLLVYLLFLWGNLHLAMGGSRQYNFHLLVSNRWEIDSNKAVNYAVLFLISLLALTAATASINSWETILKYLHPSQFGSSDPLFRQDIGFYVLRLPFYERLCNWLWGLIVSGMIVSILVYGFNGAIAWNRNTRIRIRISKSAKVHLSLLSAAIALLGAWGFWLKRYHLLYSPEGVVFGAGYTDVHAKLLAYQLLSVLAVVIAVFLLISIKKTRTFPTSGWHGIILDCLGTSQ